MRRTSVHPFPSERRKKDLNTIGIREDETLEDLQLNGLKLLQKKNGFRFGMDSVLLADFAGIRPTDSVVDFGTGTGILPLLLIGRNKGATFLAYEIQETMAEMARRTMEINHLSHRVQICCGDAGEIAQHLPACSVDAVICNPPYGQPGQALVNPTQTKAISRHQNQNTLVRFFKAAFQILKGKGKIFLVYPAPQMLDLLILLKDTHLEPKRIRFVYPNAEKAANLVLVEAVKDARPTLQPMPPLVVYDEAGNLTKELKAGDHIADQKSV